MKLNANFYIVTRPLTHYVFREKQGPFAEAEVAPPTWNELFPLIDGQIDHSQIVAYLGLSTIDKSKMGEEAI